MYWVRRMEESIDSFCDQAIFVQSEACRPHQMKQASTPESASTVTEDVTSSSVSVKPPRPRQAGRRVEQRLGFMNRLLPTNGRSPGCG